MIERLEHKKVTWIDVIKPTTDEIREIIDECNLPAELANDLTSTTPRTESKAGKNIVKITVDIPVVKRTDVAHAHEIKLIATKDRLITIHFEEIEALDRFSKEFEVVTALGNGNRLDGAHLFLTMLHHLYKSLDVKLDYLESRLQDVEQNIFDNNNEKEMLFEISIISRRLIAFKHIISVHDKALDSLEKDITTAFGKTYAPRVSDIRQTYDQALMRVKTLSSTLDDLRDTNGILLTAKQNEVMKILTIMAFITFPLTLFTSMFGMNTTTTPLIGQQNDFWIITGIMVVVSIGFFGFFKYKHWM